jgi:hypothetical protein
MTTTRLIAMASLYLAAFCQCCLLDSREDAPNRRSPGGGAVFGVVGLLAISLGEAQGWWRVPKTGSSHFRLLLWLALAVSCTPIYLMVSGALESSSKWVNQILREHRCLGFGHYSVAVYV